MRLRLEDRGVHFYDRETGFHVLLDEYPVPPEECDAGPATISIALTNACDLSCSFCYAPKNRKALSVTDIVRWCKECAAMGTLEVAFGGGEPSLYQDLIQLCRRIWSETDLGISITTHGRHLTEEFVEAVQGSISVIRVSIDAPEPLYSTMRGHPLRFVVENIKRLDGRIPFAINTVINSTTLMHLDEMALFVKEIGAVDWLLLPEVNSGKFTLSSSEWQTLDHWIGARPVDLNLRVTSEAAAYLAGPFLFENRSGDYAHITADGCLRRCSYDNGGIPLHGQTAVAALRRLKEKECCAECDAGDRTRRSGVVRPQPASLPRH